MNGRQEYALTHPLGRADGDPRDLDRLRAERRHATGLLMIFIIAVDR